MWLPANTYINICKLAQEIFKNHYKTGCRNTIEVGSRNRPMTCTYLLDMPESVAQKGFTFYDSVVHDAIYTLQRYGKERITLTDILRIMAYDDKLRLFYQKDTPQKRELRLREAVEKLMSTGIAIDFREEVKKRNLVDSEGKLISGILADKMVPLEADEDGKTFWFIEGKKLPVFQYAEYIKQIICVPGTLMTPEKYPFSNTDEVILLKRILIQRLEIMANEKNHLKSQKIRYYGEGKEDGILPLIGIKKENFAQEEVHQRKTSRVRYESRGWKNKVHDLDKKVQIILEAYKKCGYIEDYVPLRNGPRELVRGVEILGEIHRAN
ncbi:hypothetical protein ACTQWG_01160 [Blautia sp. HCP3S3_H10_1]|uniref:hypothetical protein n=1 Tax=unclassified Blautia TaxID=2648079 RepID=UPI003F90210E|nr:hypothetical protein [Clostridia bacterium]